MYFLLGQNIENPQVFVDRSGQYFYVDMCVPPDRRQTLSLIPSTRAARLMLSNAELIYPISAFVARSFESQSPPVTDPTKMQNDAATAVTNILERLYSGKVHFSLQTEIARSPIPGDPRYFEEIPRRLRDGLDAKAQLKMRAERRTRLRVSGDIYDWDLAAATLDDVSSMDDDHTILCERCKTPLAEQRTCPKCPCAKCGKPGHVQFDPECPEMQHEVEHAIQKR